MTNAALRGKPDAGNPHVRFDEGEVASYPPTVGRPEGVVMRGAKPRRGSLLYNKISPFLLAAILALSVATAASAKEIVVAPGGVSPQAAVERIRAAKRTGDTSAWMVRVKKGVYPLKETIVLRPEDSGTPETPVEWVGEDGAVLSGGEVLAGWTDDGAGVWSAPVPKGADGKPVFFESLYVNGRRADRARLPLEGVFRAKTWSETPVVEDGVTNYYEKTTVAGKGLEALVGLSRAELDAAQWRVFVKWAYAAYPVELYDAATGTLVVKGRDKIVGWKSWDGDKANYFYLENVASGFTRPGQWLYDAKTGRIRYRPLAGEKLATLEAIAPTARLVSLVEFRGDFEKREYVHDIRFRNLCFTATRTDGELCANGAVKQYLFQAARRTGATIWGNGLKNVRFERCRVFNTENYAFRFGDGVISNAIVSCEIEDAGAGGIWLGNDVGNPLQRANPKYRGLSEPWNHPFPTERLTNTTFEAVRFNVIDDNLIRRCGRVNPEGCGIVLTHAADTKVTHNEITDLFYTGVSVGWTWGYYGSYAQRNEIAFNRITNIGQHQMADMGGVYTLGASYGTVVTNNVIMDVDSSSYGGWGMYNDEGSEGVYWANNLVVNTTADSYHLHFGRSNVVENCVMVNGGTSKLRVSRCENHQQIAFRRNVVCWPEGPVFAKKDWNLLRTGGAHATFEDNLFYCTSGETELNGLMSGTVADPKFVDPAKGDWRLRSDSPALKLGFKPWDYSKAGRRR